MDLERIAAELRPRGSWESMDLGFALAREWFFPLWALWWLTVVPTAGAALFWLHDSAALWLLLVWWLKPMFESAQLFWLSRALFGERMPPIRSLEHFAQAFPRRMWPQLLWRRIGFTRSLTMPATLLEGLHGDARRRRLSVLGSAAGAGWLTVICAHLEAVLWLGGALTLALLVPEYLPGVDAGQLVIEQIDLGGRQGFGAWLGIALLVFAMSVIAPFYVAAGFALYLGRRTDLEAWDLELVFRRRAAATSSAKPRRAAVAGRTAPLAVMALGCVLGLGLAGTVEAARADSAAPTPRQARALITEVLADSDFGGTRREASWVYIGDREESIEAKDEPALRLPADLITTVATALKWLLTASAAAVTLILLYGLRHSRLPLPRLRLPFWLRRRASAAGTDSDTPKAARGLPASDCALASTPGQAPAEAAALLAAGDTRGALGLLYRERIAHLRAEGLVIPTSATESECLSVVASSSDPSEQEWLAALTESWRAAAYARRTPEHAAVERLIATWPTAAPASRRVR